MQSRSGAISVDPRDEITVAPGRSLPTLLSMRRRFAFVLVLVTFISQVLAVAGRADALGHINVDQHHAAHWIGEAHHHLTDDSLAFDDSQESRQHLLLDYGLTAPGLVSSFRCALPPLPGTHPPLLVSSLIPDPYLAGLKRPPRPVA